MADVEFQVVGKVAHVRLNRESGMNAITGEMDELLYAAWQRINAEADIWCAILSTTGEKAFCIGADVSEGPERRSEEHTSELQSLMRISYAVFCLKKKQRQDK